MDTRITTTNNNTLKIDINSLGLSVSSICDPNKNSYDKGDEEVKQSFEYSNNNISAIKKLDVSNLRNKNNYVQSSFFSQKSIAKPLTNYSSTEPNSPVKKYQYDNTLNLQEDASKEKEEAYQLPLAKYNPTNKQFDVNISNVNRGSNTIIVNHHNNLNINFYDDPSQLQNDTVKAKTPKAQKVYRMNKQPKPHDHSNLPNFNPQIAESSRHLDSIVEKLKDNDDNKISYGKNNTDQCYSPTKNNIILNKEPGSPSKKKNTGCEFCIIF